MFPIRVLSSQEMMDGNIKLVGSGKIRDVYIVKYGGEKLVVKVLREDFVSRASKTRVERIFRWEAVALSSVRDGV